MNTVALTSAEPEVIAPDGEIQPFRLTPMDRSDCCPSRAYIKVMMRSENLLYFCLHHYTQHKSALLPQVLKVRDESKQLTFNRHIGSAN